MPALIPAATAMLIRDGGQGLEVLLLRRSQAMDFAAGYWVFPGGRIDAEDYPGSHSDQHPDNQINKLSVSQPPPEAIHTAARQAAVRETYEEAQLQICPQQLIPMSQWLAPKGMSKRFNTWFFIAEHNVNDAVQVDNYEIDNHRWCRPQQALADFENQQLAMMPPTYVSLLELARQATVAEALAFYQSREPLRYAASYWLDAQQDRCMLYAGDAGYEANNAHIAGARHRLWENGGTWIYECDFLS
ncbi:NUDIX hydrolase [Dasania marina]|uniref:NUDIX hydrolase n=1 Tax=Dasania marina TaxID=471499 RepID=UPI0030DDCEA9|tara:strand:- start:46299 stop:47033 length:735 start_codon:yes stop_codon:yes gene_type:complete